MTTIPHSVISEFRYPATSKNDTNPPTSKDDTNPVTSKILIPKIYYTLSLFAASSHFKAMFGTWKRGVRMSFSFFSSFIPPSFR